MVIALVGHRARGRRGRSSFLEAFWASLMRTLDAGTMGADAGWGFRIVMLLVTIGGIFIVSTLIGILASGIEGKLDDLRKGRSRVLEADHTVILNWSRLDLRRHLRTRDRQPEPARARASSSWPNRDKVEMEDEIAAKVTKLGKTRVICRSGDPTDLYDLSLVSPETSRSIIILSPEASRTPTATCSRSILALVNDPTGGASSYRIAAEMKDAEERRARPGRSAATKCRLVLADDLIARIVVHSSRQSGLSAVYSELLDFDGCEIYTIEQPALDRQHLRRRADGLQHRDADRRLRRRRPGLPQPADGNRDAAGAQGRAASPRTMPRSRSRSTTSRSTCAAIVAAAHAAAQAPERTLMLGWNRRAPIIARELSRYVIPGSVLTVAADVPDLDDAIAGLSLRRQQPHHRVRHRRYHQPRRARSRSTC